MIKSLLRVGCMAAVTAGLAFGLGGAASADTVYSNNQTPGDFFHGSVAGNPDGASLSLGTPGWSYENVRNDSVVGINNTYADNHGGNGSVYFNPVGSGAGTGKADITYGSGGVLGNLSDLRALSFEWYRDSASDVAQHFSPSLRIGITIGSGVDQKSGYLVWENVYNGGSTKTAVATDQWVEVDAFKGGLAKLWNNPDLGLGGPQYKTLDDWLKVGSPLADAVVTGFQIGVGSGWKGTFIGAADYLSYQFDGGPVTTVDFEVNAVPEPSSIALVLGLGGLGLAGRAWRRRRTG